MLDNKTAEDLGNKGTAIVVGASLAGLMAGIALAQQGIHITILEKAENKARSGSGLQVEGKRMERSKTAKILQKIVSGGKTSIQLWSTLESRLRKEAFSHSNIDIHYNVFVQAINQDDASAWVYTKDEKTFHADIIIGADGHRSTVRRLVAPHKPNAMYAGYVVWVIDTINENELPLKLRPTNQDLGVNMFQGPHGFLFGNIIDNPDEVAGEGKRQLGCAWYDNTKTDLLYEIGCVEENVVHHSLKGPDIPKDTIEELAEDARTIWPEPWRSTTLRALQKRGLTGIPVKEYIPDNLMKARIALVGDAAHVPAPITASGFNQSLEDAIVLGDCVANGVAGENAVLAMEVYEAKRLNKVRRIVKSGKSFGASFGRF